MYEAGWASHPGSRFVQLDYSSVVIEQMKTRYNDHYYETLWGPDAAQECPRMEFVCCDVTEGIPFEDGSFDLIICKGIFDAILCSLGSLCSIRRLVKDCTRLLNDGGVLFVCTYGNPDSRVVFLEDENGGYEEYWRSVSVEKVPSRVGISHQRHSNSNM